MVTDDVCSLLADHPHGALEEPFIFTIPSLLSEQNVTGMQGQQHERTQVLILTDS